VSNRYFTGWAVFGRAGADWAAHAALMESWPGSNRLQDNPGGVPSLLPYLRTLQAERVDVEMLMRLDGGALRLQPVPEGVRVRRAVWEDLPALVEHYRDAGDMSRSAAMVERPLRDTRVFLAEAAEGVGVDGGGILAAALTNAETTTFAMIGGVYTVPAARGRGLAQAVCGALCAELQASGKVPVLYWVSPDAGHVYHKLGFREIGTWRAVRLAPRTEAEEGG